MIVVSCGVLSRSLISARDSTHQLVSDWGVGFLGGFVFFGGVDTYQGTTQLQSRAHYQQAAAGTGRSPGPAPGPAPEPLKETEEMIICIEKTPAGFSSSPRPETSGGTGPTNSSPPLRNEQRGTEFTTEFIAINQADAGNALQVPAGSDALVHPTYCVSAHLRFHTRGSFHVFPPWS